MIEPPQQKPVVYPERPHTLWLSLEDGQRYHVTFLDRGLSWDIWRSVRIENDGLYWRGFGWALRWLTDPREFIYSRTYIQPLGEWPLYRPLAVNQPEMTTRQRSQRVQQAYELTAEQLKVACKKYAAPKDLLLQRLIDLELQFQHARPELPFIEFLNRPWRRLADWSSGDALDPLEAVLSGFLHHVEEALLKQVEPQQLLPYNPTGGTDATTLAHSLFALPR